MPKDRKLSPPLKWAGGKRWFLPTFKEFWRPFQQYRLVEPFAGGLAIALGIMPAVALLNDINPHLINFYRQVQKGLRISLPMANDKMMYYQHRERFNELIRQELFETAEAASLFYYLNRTGYNGLCRFNKQGFFNVPMGRYKRINYVTDFSPYMPAFKNWKFSSQDFAQTTIDERDFIYADPPYDGDFTDYSAGGFDWNDQQRLANWLAEQTVPTIISNLATPRIEAMYQQLGFTLQYLTAPRRIASNGNRMPAKELIAFNNITP